MREYRLPREKRLRHQTDFNRVHGGNWYAADHVLVLRAASNGLGITRLGVSLSRKVGSAVVRNRWKRLVREAFRRTQEDLPQGLDLVVRPRQGATANAAAVQHSLVELVRRVARRMPKDKP